MSPYTRSRAPDPTGNLSALYVNSDANTTDDGDWTAENVYADGDLIVEVAFIQSSKESRKLFEDGRSISWVDIQRFAVAPGYRARVSSVVLSVASDILRETFQLLSTQKPGKWFRPLNHTQRTRGIYWYRVNSNAAGPKEINVVCVSDFNQFFCPEWKPLLSESFITLIYILHHKGHVVLDTLLGLDLEEGTERSLVYLSTLSELAWVFGCEDAVAPTVQLARIRLQARASECHDDTENINRPRFPELPELRGDKYGFFPGHAHYDYDVRLTPFIKLALFCNDRLAFRKATQLYILSIDAQSAEDVPRPYEDDNMGILPFMRSILQQQRDSIIKMCCDVLNLMYITLGKWWSPGSPVQERSCCLFLGSFIRELGNSLGLVIKEPLTFPLHYSTLEDQFGGSPFTHAFWLRKFAVQMAKMQRCIEDRDSWVWIKFDENLEGTGQLSASLEFGNAVAAQGWKTLSRALTEQLDRIFEGAGLDLDDFRKRLLHL